MGPYIVQNTSLAEVAGIVALQRACFPPPFPEDLLWKAEHIESHLRLFPEGQWVVLYEGTVVASCTNALVSKSNWDAHMPFDDLLGGLSLPKHDPLGNVLYGVDISVNPDHRKKGLARLLYAERFDYVTRHNIDCYGTVCRIPDFNDSPYENTRAYIDAVISGEITDRTLSPLIKIGLNFQGIIKNYMEDEESGNAGAILEWTK